MLLHTNYNCNFIEDKINNKKIVLFGAGKAAIKTLECLSRLDEKYLDKIFFFIDNSPDKWGESIIYFNHKYDVFSVDYMINNWSNNILLIISTQKFEEVVDQLNKIQKFEEAEAVFYEDVVCASIMSDFWMPDNIRITDRPLIPKVIHYCWFGRNPIPDRYREWMSTWKKYCPDYEIVEWNEDNYDYKKNEYMYEAYKAKKWGFVSDYARLDIIYNHGGIYLDTDVELVKNLDDLLYQKAFVGMENGFFVNNGSGFGSIPKLLNLKKQLNVYENRHFIRADGTFDISVTGPILQTEVMVEEGFLKENRYQIIDEVTVYPLTVLGAIIGSNVIINDNVYTIHHYDGSWLPTDIKCNNIIRQKRISEKLKYYKNR